MKRPKTIVIILIILAALKYFWFLPQMPFDADQEYLALKSGEILSGKLTLLGAPTSIGGMFTVPEIIRFPAGIVPEVLAKIITIVILIISLIPIDPTYTLVSPANWHQIKSDVIFGDIGIVLPKEKNKQ